MLARILGTGILFFLVLGGLWLLLWHTDISSVKDLLKPELTGYSKTSLSGYELGIFFSVFVMLQFWNLFNAKYYRTDRSLLIDLKDLILCPRKVKESYSQGFILISLVIVLGQVLIVSFAGKMFNVSPLQPAEWGWILLITSPVLIVADLARTIKNTVKR